MNEHLVSVDEGEGIDVYLDKELWYQKQKE
jgi:hypothetical protein